MALDNLSSPVEQRGAADTRCETLDLDVIDGKVRWSRRTTNLADFGRPGDIVVSDLNLDDDTRKTIELLTEEQQLLIDLMPRAEMQRTQVDSVLFRLAVRVGELLYGVLFDDPELARVLNEAMQRIRNGQLDLMRIELEFDGTSAFMSSWPWEYLKTSDDRKAKRPGQFLALSAKLVLNRTLSARFSDEFSTPKPIVLLVVSRARTLGPVAGADVIAKIQQLDKDNIVELHTLIEPEPSELLSEDYRPTATWAAFSQIVKAKKPHIIHFIGHGRLNFSAAMNQNVGELAFVDQSGDVKWMMESEIVQALDAANPRLVFLQACESALSDPRANISGVAMRLALGRVPAVVAMRAKVQNQVANAFAIKFYDMVGRGLPIDWAVKEGRDAITLIEGLSDSQRLAFGVPVVYLSSYQGLIEQAPDNRPARGASTEKPVDQPNLEPIAAICPNCTETLDEGERKGNYCWNCSLQLRCLTCKTPFSKPLRVNVCGVCRTPVARTVQDATVSTQPNFIKPTGPEAQDRGQTQDPPAQNVPQELQADLRKRFPTRPN